MGQTATCGWNIQVNQDYADQIDHDSPAHHAKCIGYLLAQWEFCVSHSMKLITMKLALNCKRSSQKRSSN